MKVEDAVMMILKAVYLKRDEIYVCPLLYYFVPRLAFVSTTLNRWIAKVAIKR